MSQTMAALTAPLAEALAHGATVPRLAAGLAAGVLLGLFHFASLWWSLRLYSQGGVLTLLLVKLGRFAVLGGGLWLVAHLGPLPLLLAAAGLLLMRPVVQRRVEKAP